MGESNNSGSSRYARVIAILDDAQGSCVPDYQGYGAFWRSIEVLEKAELYGQRMIAPPAQGDAPDPNAPARNGSSCCDNGNGHNSSGDGSNGDGGTTPPMSPEPGDDGPAVRAVDLDSAEYVVDASCWPSGGSGGGGGSSGGGAKRSDRSGLILGLRGQYPFDGEMFPPLLWSAARRVTASEIAFIAAWIDDGCPTGDEDSAAAGSSRSSVSIQLDEELAYAFGERKHEVSTRHVNDDARDKSEVNKRKEVSTLNVEELRRFREALACMAQYNHSSGLDERSWFHWARIHTNSCQHGWEQFLPWHRLYLYFLEQTLQDYDDRITLPYWSWSDYADANRTTNLTETLDVGVIPEPYRCWLTQQGLDRLGKSGLFDQAEQEGLAHTLGHTYNSGRRFLKAAGMSYTLAQYQGRAVWSDKTRAIYNELMRTNPMWFPNRWPGSIGSGHYYPTPDDIKAILNVSNWNDFGSGPAEDHYFGALEEVHNGMHNFSGGQNPDFASAAKAAGIDEPDQNNNENPFYGWMVNNRVTAYDAIFWGHHANVDRLWAVWQELHPGVDPIDLDGILPPWSLKVKDTLSTKKLGYEYVRDTYHYPIKHPNKPVKRFNTEAAGVRDSVLDLHRRAEVRIHRVRRANLPNATIRVFVNAPEASSETSIRDNAHYVGQVTTFHGSCYGGPGHCDLPLPRTRPHDRRPLHHHEPRNFRIDATAAVQRMVTRGETDLSVHLVVVGLDGKPKDDAVIIDGVSLNFID